MPINPSIIGQLNAKPLQFGNPLDDYTKAQTMRHLMLQGNAQEQAASDEEAVKQAYQQSGGDVNKLRQSLYGAGQHKTLEALDKNLLDNQVKQSTIKQNDSRAKNFDSEIAKRDYDAAHQKAVQTVQVILSQPDPMAVQGMMEKSLANPDLPPMHKEKILKAQEGLKATIEPFMKGNTAPFQQFLRQQAAAELGPKDFAETLEPKIMSQDVGDKARILAVPKTGVGPVTVLDSTAKGQSPNSAAAGGTPTSLTENGMKVYSELATEGKLPPGYGRWGLNDRNKFLNAEGEKRFSSGGTGVSISGDQASAKSNAGALTALQKDITFIKPYKEMLDTNANIAIDLAKKVTKVNPHFANKTLNWITNNVTGDADTAEYLAQIQFVKDEAARVIKNPRLVGVMSDSARQEMEKVINGDLTFNQTERVLRRVQSDGQNRIAAMEKEAGRLKGSFGNKGINAAPEASTTHTTIVAPNGKTIVKTGSYGGKKVIQYSDGSIEYAN